MDGKGRTTGLGAIFLGEESLLAQCGDHWIGSGQVISLVVTGNEKVQQWCQRREIAYCAYSELAEHCAELSIDYLFSVSNLRILPSELINLPRVAAINFHDGPLPHYIGVNTPSWAIINAETSYGITFHLMTDHVDRGDILIQRNFEISDADSSLTLNAKCYEVAGQAFKDLIDGLLTVGLASACPQNITLPSRSYTKVDRPSPVLHWSSSAVDNARLINALDFGHTNNPLCLAVVWSGTDYLFVVGGGSIDTNLNEQPGKVLSVDGDKLTVACSRGAVTFRVNGFHSLAVGCELPIVTEARRHDLQLQLRAVAKDETYWCNRFSEIAPIVLPDKMQGFRSFTELPFLSVVKPITPNSCSPQLYTLSLLLAFLGRIAKQSTFDIALVTDAESSGLLSQAVPLRAVIEDDNNVDQLIGELQNNLAEISALGVFPKDLPRRIQNDSVELFLGAVGVSLCRASLQPVMDLLFEVADDGRSVRWLYDKSKYSDHVIESMHKQFDAWVASAQLGTDLVFGSFSTLSNTQLTQFQSWNDTDTLVTSCTVQAAFEQRVSKDTDLTALICGGREISYRNLNSRANQVASFLLQQGTAPGDLVGVHMDRSIELVVTMLGILKAGCAYVPLDPSYPRDRLDYMIRDSKLSLIVADFHHVELIDPVHSVVTLPLINDTATPNLGIACSLEALAYVIYTSGSTGNPKGVMVEHGNVDNFLCAMDQRFPEPPATWLAVTSISFDISVLELFWTLTRGYRVVIHREGESTKPKIIGTPETYGSMDFSLFYWNVAQPEDESGSKQNSDCYRLLLEGARYADENNFTAVWNPERHFSSFGGSFPNPAVTCAAVAAITKNVQIRAGSCVAPLHSPIRIAEDWSVVDNLSNGRAGVAFAAGWAAPDFAIRPDRFEDAKDYMFEQIDMVRRLWRGETIAFPGPKGPVDVRTLPRPIQPELPVWVTTAGNPENFKQAGRVGANLLTHLLGQTFEELAEKIALYREERKKHGHDGPGHVSLMLHSCVGDSVESVKALVKKPMKTYLKSAMFLVKDAAWQFPTFKKLSKDTGASLDAYFETITDSDMDALLDFAFERYFTSSGLFGSVDDALATVKKCHNAGVDEIACLIDFGMEDDLVLQQLPFLGQVRERANESPVNHQLPVTEQQDELSIAELIKRYDITHMQCTPSMAGMLVADRDSRESLAGLQQMLVGGEALPPSLANALIGCVDGKVSNMYGPTETTIWSTSVTFESSVESVSIGTPIANTQIYIVDEKMRLLPPGVPGELLIGGLGVVRGYLNRPELTSERFIPNPFSRAVGERLYRTGDLASWTDDGALVCLGRLDHQVKIAGYRVELGEIENELCSIESIGQAVVIVREDTPGIKRLVAYIITPAPGVDDKAIASTLSRKLPTFMVPSIYVEVSAFPQTPNGKVDRSALPAPSMSTRKAIGSVPANQIEMTIAQHWKDVLQINEVGTQDNFFDMGGHSLLVIDVMQRLNSDSIISKHVGMVDMYRYTTIEALAKHIALDPIALPDTDRAGKRAQSRKAALARRQRKNKKSPSVTSRNTVINP